jgi:hypothetical protein
MQSERGKHIAYWVVAGLFIAAYVLRHISAGYIFPVPWPDEASFLWQAIGFQHTNTLFAPELNPARDVFWMPPGYMIVIGALFKVFGYSLALARTASLICMCAVFVMLAAVIRKYALPLLSIFLLGAVFLTTPVIAAGNVARMDPMLFVIIAGALLLFKNGRDYTAFALLAISPLIHPNGIYFIAGALVYFILEKRWRNLSLRGFDILLFAIAVVLWGFYITYIAKHWGDFLSDMQYQLHRKSSNLYVFTLSNAVFLVPFIAIVVYGARKKTLDVLLTCFGFIMWWVYTTGGEMWYQCFYGMSFVILFCGFLPTFPAFLHHRPPSNRSFKLLTPLLATRTRARVFIFVMIALGVSLGYYAMPFYGSPLKIWNGSWGGMSISRTDIPYMTDGDIAAVKKYLIGLQSSPDPVYVRFFPEGDVLFFTDMEKGNLKFDDQVLTWIPASVLILHVSRHDTNRWDDEIKKYFAAINTQPGDSSHILTQRDSTEIFYFGNLPKP